jgi:hypothetical protein
VCLYVDEGSQTYFVGQSHPFNRATGREILPSPPLHNRRCGSVQAEGANWRVTVRGPASCSLAAQTIRSYLRGGGTPNHNVAIIGYRTLRGGWECGEIGHGAVPTCARKTKAGLEAVQANIE